MFRILILAALSAVLSFAADLAGKWELRSVRSTGEELAVQVVFRQVEGKLSGALYVEDESLPLQDVTVNGDDVAFKIQSDEATYTVKVTVSGATMTGGFAGSDGTSGKITGKKA